MPLVCKMYSKQTHSDRTCEATWEEQWFAPKSSLTVSFLVLTIPARRTRVRNLMAGFPGSQMLQSAKKSLVFQTTVSFARLEGPVLSPPYYKKVTPTRSTHFL